MNTSTAGLELIKHFEGLRLSVYKDVAGFLTIGYGHKLQPGESFQSGVTVTEAEDIFLRDVAIAEAVVSRLVKVPVTQGQFDALVDFVFNLGGGRLASSTMLKLLNAGKYDDAAQQLLEWDHAGGVEVEGLKRRRETELQLWMGGVTSSSGDGLSSSPERADA